MRGSVRAVVESVEDNHAGQGTVPLKALKKSGTRCFFDLAGRVNDQDGIEGDADARLRAGPNNEEHKNQTIR